MGKRLTPDEFREKVKAWGVPPDHVVLPRAEVEALRARCERLCKVIIDRMPIEAVDAAYDDGSLDINDMADDLRPLEGE